MGIQLPSIKGHSSPIFGPYLLWPNGWMDQEATWYGVGIGPGDMALDRDSAFPPQKLGTAPNFQPMSIVAKRLDGSRCHLYAGRPRRRPHCVTWGPSLPPKGAQPPVFDRCLLWPNGRRSQLLLSTCFYMYGIQCSVDYLSLISVISTQCSQYAGYDGQTVSVTDGRTDRQTRRHSTYCSVRIRHALHCALKRDCQKHNFYTLYASIAISL